MYRIPPLHAGLAMISDFLGAELSGDCTGDYIDDTTTGKTVYRGDCSVAENSCPDHVGYDHINNYMNYGTDRCQMHFTPLQGARMRLLFGLRKK